MTKKNVPPSSLSTNSSQITSESILIAKLQEENIHLKELVKALKSENSKLKKKIVKIEAKYISTNNELKHWKHLKDPHGDIKHDEYLRSLTDEGLDAEEKRITDLLKQYNKKTSSKE